MEKILVICAHPDDEVLGCGGTLLKHKKKGDQERIRYKKNLTILEQFDAIAILTDWQEFRRFDFKSSKVFDGRNLLDENKSNVIYIGK